MTSSARPSSRRWARRFGIAFAALCVLAIAGEVLVRLHPGAAGTQAVIETQSRLDKMIYAPDPELGARLAPSRHDRVETLDFTYTLQTDHAGFPNPEPWPGQIDVAVLGNSLLIGPGVGMDGQFTGLLGHRLGGRTVLNLGLPGGGTEHQLLTYRRFVAPLRPTLVVAALWVVWDIDNTMQFDHWLSEHKPDPDYTHYRYTYNETHRSGAPPARSGRERITDFLRHQLARSQLLRVAHQSLQALRGHEDMRRLVSFPDGQDILLSVRDQERLAQGMDRAGNPDLRDTFFRPLEQMRTEVEAEGARFLVVLVPSKEEIYGAKAWPAILRPIEEVKSGLEARRLPVLDLYPVFRELGRERPPFYRADMHLDPFGNQIVADAIAKWIEDERIFRMPSPAASAAH